MSKIKNEPRNQDNAQINYIRQIHAKNAEFLGSIYQEGVEQNVDIESIMKNAFKKRGCRLGQQVSQLITEEKGLTAVKDILLGADGDVYDIEVQEWSKDKIDLHYYFCPQIPGWQKMGLSDEEMSKMCRIIMDSDAGLADGMGCTFSLGKTIADGHEYCEIKCTQNKS